MFVKSVSTAFTTNNVEESRDFYVKHFGAKVTFDCGWYVNLQFGAESESLQFMSPQQPEHQLSSANGLIYNFAVEDIDAEYTRLTDDGLSVIVPLEDHPWGDRGYPNSITLYIYSVKEPTEEFKQYYK